MRKWRRAHADNLCHASMQATYPQAIVPKHCTSAGYKSSMAIWFSSSSVRFPAIFCTFSRTISIRTIVFALRSVQFSINHGTSGSENRNKQREKMLINFGCKKTKKTKNENTLYKFIDRISSHFIRITYNLLLAQQSTHSDMQILCHPTAHNTHTDTQELWRDRCYSLSHSQTHWLNAIELKIEVTWELNHFCELKLIYSRASHFPYPVQLWAWIISTSHTMCGINILMDSQLTPPEHSAK